MNDENGLLQILSGHDAALEALFSVQHGRNRRVRSAAARGDWDELERVVEEAEQAELAKQGATSVVSGQDS